MTIYDSVDKVIGNTPLVKIADATEDCAEVVVKLEYQNPGGSVKDRLALGVIRAAEESGELKPGGLIVEATSGNTGIGIAMIAAARGYRLILTMPDSMSLERRRILAAYGAELVLTPGKMGMKGAIAKAKEIAEEKGGFQTLQFDNPANAAIHYKTTGPELERDTDGALDALVVGVGTGGTLAGAGAYLKDKLPKIRLVAVEPSDSPVLSGGEPGPHKIQGIGAGFVPSILDTKLIDEVVAVDLDTAKATSRRLAAEHGLLSGISAGANTHAAFKIARDIAREKGTGIGARVATVIPSNGERYMSTVLFEDLFGEA
ncbi:cysteine synthase A [Sulfidibacter corallicola]|uniref:Cysteine synthase n=1 Tax=Sulfidibacter corallicola TaxID=2818388 RepID=A0A8A4THV6_SULCO|nr:cysteine synthase A [Sulfidibacter corallicola]QTD48348.1 cysteine synthase A [Sulfidibacter corallicola]